MRCLHRVANPAKPPRSAGFEVWVVGATLCGRPLSRMCAAMDGRPHRAAPTQTSKSVIPRPVHTLAVGISGLRHRTHPNACAAPLSFPSRESWHLPQAND